MSTLAKLNTNNFRRPVVLLMSSVVFLLLTLSLAAQAQRDRELDQKIFASGSDYPKVEDLTWISENFLIKQRKKVDDLTRIKFGKPVSNSRADLALLQRIINEGLVGQKDKKTMQALGVILGDVYVDEHKHLEWKRYTDELGQGHAVCVKNTKHCLFPITMLSRRMEVGLKPEVVAVYDKGWQAIKPQLPKRPFDSSKNDEASKDKNPGVKEK